MVEFYVQSNSKQAQMAIELSFILNIAIIKKFDCIWYECQFYSGAYQEQFGEESLCNDLV